MTSRGHDRISVHRATVREQDEQRAVEGLREQLHRPGLSVVLVFCSPAYDLERLGPLLHETFPCPVVGCTTAGEIESAAGYVSGAIVGVGLASPELAAHPVLLSPLETFDLAMADRAARALHEDLTLVDRPGPDNVFSLLLVDGLSMREEQLAAALYGAMGEIPLVGGSAGDDLAFRRTSVYHDGRFRSDAAVLTLFETTLPFAVFKTQHFEPSEQRVVITAARPEQRIVDEIDGLPAAEAYARLVGLSVALLTPSVFSTYPLMLRIGGESYVRSIQRANPDGSLTFYCAIDEGLVLRIGRGVGLVENLEAQLEALEQRIGRSRVVIGCDCILRRLEALERGLDDPLRRALASRNFVGFSTYGEQFNALHVNQTLTGVAIGG